MRVSLNAFILDKTANIKAGNFPVKPEFFYLNSNEGKQRFQELLNQNNSIQLYDTIYDQLTELIKIKYLSQNLKSEDIPGLIEKHLNNLSVMEYGVWVYYPWLNKAVHILDEDEFIKVRTNRNQQKITENELQILKTKKIGVIGLSVGQCIVSTLILERCCGEIRLGDFDDIQLSNLNRINTALYNLGSLKIVQVARAIAEIDPFIKVVCYKEGVHENNIEDFLLADGKIDLLIEECDSIDIKVLSRIKAKQFKIPVVMDTNDRGMVDVERYDIEADYPLLHGNLSDVAYANLKNLTREQALPVFMKFFSFNNLSARSKVSFLELGQTVSTFSQIASSVVLGGAIVTDIARRILLNHLKISGRFYVDIENIIKEDTAPSYLPPEIKELQPEEMFKIADEVVLNDTDVLKVPVSFIENVVTNAGLAPSSGNDQPWRFLFKNNHLYLFHELSRSYSFGDYRNMASYISLGTALENLVLSAHYYNRETTVKLFPSENEAKCVAVISFKEQAGSTTEKHEFDELFNYISLRCTNRKIQPNESAAPDILKELKAATEAIPGAKVDFLTEKKDLEILGSIISACDRIRIMNPQGHYEFFNREIRWNTKEAETIRTGMDVTTLELNAPAMLVLKAMKDDNVMKVLRDIDGLKAFRNVSTPNALNAAAMGLVTMPSYNRIDFVNGGRAVQKQWLKSTELGYAYHPMLIPLYLFPRILYGNGEGLNSKIVAELKLLRKQFMQLYPGDEKRGEVFLFRIFKADDIEKRALRLPLSKILLIENDD